MEKKELNVDSEYAKRAKQVLKEGEDGQPIMNPVRKKVDYTKFAPRRVYNRKILRNIIKRQLGTNKIRNAWHQLRAEGRV